MLSLRLGLCVAALGLVFCVQANVELSSGWTLDASLPYGTCTHAPIAGEYRTGPPYTGANADPLIGEAVGSGSQGITCSFTESVASHMPAIWREHYLLAASQDVYAGKHLPVCEGCANLNSLWSDECKPDAITRAQADAGTDMCSASCGECVIITGYETNNSAIWIVNEIADVNAVGQNGRGLNFHLDDDHYHEIRGWGGVSKDIRWRRVPCPTDGGMKVLVTGRWGDTAIYLTILNHKVGVATVAARGGAGSGQTEFVPLVRDWTNRWHWESYGCDTCITWQTTPIHGGSTAKDYDLRITSRDGQSVVCRGLASSSAQGTVMACVDASGNPLQFSGIDGLDPLQACDGSWIDPPASGGGGGGGGGDADTSADSDPRGNGLSPGGVAALVIVFGVLPVCIAGAAVGWALYRKKKSAPFVPEGLKSKWDHVRSKVFKR